MSNQMKLTNKLGKKLIAFLMVVAMMCPSFGFAAQAETTDIIGVSVAASKTSVNLGSTDEITVSLNVDSCRNDGITALNAEIVLPKDKDGDLVFEYVDQSLKLSNIFTGMIGDSNYDATNNKVIIGLMGINNVHATGTLATFKVKLAEGVAEGDYVFDAVVTAVAYDSGAMGTGSDEDLTVSVVLTPEAIQAYNAGKISALKEAVATANESMIAAEGVKTPLSIAQLSYAISEAETLIADVEALTTKVTEEQIESISAAKVAVEDAVTGLEDMPSLSDDCIVVFEGNIIEATLGDTTLDDTYTFAVKSQSGVGFTAINADTVIDTNVFTIKETSTSATTTNFPNAMVTDNREVGESSTTYKYALMGMSGMTGTGALYTVKLELKEGIAAGVYPIMTTVTAYGIEGNMSDLRAKTAVIQGAVIVREVPPTPEAEAQKYLDKHADTLAKTAETVAIADEAAVATAKADYAKLSDEAKAIVDAQNKGAALIATLEAAIAQKKAEVAGQAFIDAYKATIDMDMPTRYDEDAATAVNTALDAYDALTDDVKALANVTAAKAKLDALKAAFSDLGYTVEAEKWLTDNAAILAKDVTNVTTADKGAIDEALAGYAKLDEKAQKYGDVPAAYEKLVALNKAIEVAAFKEDQDVKDVNEKAYDDFADEFKAADEAEKAAMKDKIAKAEEAYKALTDEAKKNDEVQAIKDKIDELKSYYTPAVSATKEGSLAENDIDTISRGTTVKEFLDGLTLSKGATAKVYNAAGEEVDETADIENDMKLVVTAPSGDEAEYTLAIRTYAPAGGGGGTTPSEPDEPETPVVAKVPTARFYKTIFKGQKVQIDTTGVDADTTITFKSSNTKVATVTDAGLVTAVGKGQAYIKVTMKKGDVVTRASIRVKVKASKGNKKTWKDVKVTTDGDSVRVVVVGKSLKKGQSSALKLKNLNETATYTFTSSNKKVATVSKAGKIKAVKKGTVTIKAVVKDGDTERTYSYKLTVTK